MVIVGILVCMHARVLECCHVQLFCDSMDCSQPGSSVHGIFPAKILEWVAISSSKGSSRPGEIFFTTRVIREDHEHGHSLSHKKATLEDKDVPLLAHSWVRQNTRKL